MREYRTIDKTGWGDGPWQDEPDKRQWKDTATGLPCLIVRSPWGGNLCGYVGVPSSHPAHGKGYSPDDYDKPTNLEAAINAIEVHGGLTFSSPCGHGADESRGICHVPDPGEPDDIWWFGFDCGHFQDLCPASAASIPGYLRMMGSEVTYRTVSYVEAEIRGLAVALAEMQSL
jgi:hypothetical protein